MKPTSLGAIASPSFHLLDERQRQAHQSFSRAKGWQARGSRVTLRDRTVTYQFFPHFHPYVLPLVQRLNQGGLAALVEADTLYLPQPNPANGQLQPLTPLPDSTRATLSAPVTATRADGTTVQLAPGTSVTLPDGASITIPGGTLVTRPDGSTFPLPAAASVPLPGALPLSSSSGSQWTIAGTPTILPDHTAVTLPYGATLAVRTDDGSSVDLPNGTAVTIRRGLPRPVFYDDGIFDFDASHYHPNPAVVVRPYPVKDLDFTSYGAYSLYNWELFFHVPLLIAVHLSQNQKYQDAQRWFHYIFDPTDHSAGPTPERFWKVLPFQDTDVRMIEEILVNLATNQDPGLAQHTIDSIGN